MNKSEFISAVAEKAGLDKTKAKAAIEAYASVVADALKEGDKISLIGFGTFSVSERTERQGINPRTKEKQIIPAKKVVKFKAGAELSNAVK